MKKIIVIGIVIIVILGGVFCYLFNKDGVTTLSKSSVKSANNVVKQTKVKSEKPIASVNDANVNEAGKKQANKIVQLKTNTNNSVENKTYQNLNNDKGTIDYRIPSGKSSYTLSTILVENTSGSPISEELLGKYIRSWMIVGQYNCGGICAASGTEWGNAWINEVSNSIIKEAFINANGNEALSQNISANEFVKTVQEMDRLTANDIPFTMSQATKIIENMMMKDGYGTPSQVRKIVLEKGSPAEYEVYMKFQNKNNEFAYWNVQANTGYAIG